MDEGLYESLVTQRLLRALARAAPAEPELAEVDPALQPDVLTRHVAAAVRRRLDRHRDPAVRARIVNRLLDDLDSSDDDVVPPPRQLLSLVSPAGPGSPASRVRPVTPLSDAALLTNAVGEPGLANELRAELDSADQVDLLCAFVKWHGVRLLEQQLAAARDRGVRLRVITTTYLGATERLALDRLVTHLGADVRVQYDALRTRLHAKAWLFRRRTGFDTAYVGSSNLSRAALLDGVEWNVRLSAVATPDLMAKFAATFDTYWADPSYEPYDPDRDADRLDDALAVAAGHRRTDGSAPLLLSGLEVAARPHQQRMLEALDVERTVHDRHRNLLVAATGTGKTVVAALDYRRLAAAPEPRAPRPGLLFVAHRKEILQQSLRTYREVLRDSGFGELYVGDSRPERWRHVFASVQSLSSYGVDRIPPDAFDVVVIDEFHHAEARTYRRLLDRLRPRELLGLTATPERGDGIDVKGFFGGRAAYEMRLWDALAAELLSPFHYFGVCDDTDLTAIDWRSGRYDVDALSALYTGNDARLRMVLQHLRDKVADLRSMRALGFCVSVAHAEYMAAAFTRRGIPSRVVSGRTPAREREHAIAALRRREVNVLFAADLFNEGLDIPEVDTVLFLRPTESATVFLQQLGRGLRLCEGKAVLTVLDFVGHHRKEFRLDLRYRALTGATRRELDRQVEAGFPFLPSGCQVVLDRVTQAAVLRHVREQLTGRWAALVAELRAHPTSDLGAFLADSGADLADVVRGDRSWTRLRRDARVVPARVEAAVPARAAGSAVEAALLKRVRTFAHVDDLVRAETYRRLLEPDGPAFADLPPGPQAYARMLFFSVWPDGGGHDSYASGLAALRAQPDVRTDIAQVVGVAMAAAAHVTRPLEGRLRDLPLRVHARYTREEILAALGYVAVDGRKPNSFREGVLWCEAAYADALFVTLRKAEVDYSPTTMYRDYAISPGRFHWESQSVTTVASPTGQRYLQHRERGSHVLLFCRADKTTEFGTGAPFLFLGTVQYESHRGERPIAITWRLDVPMPGDMFAEASVVAS